MSLICDNAPGNARTFELMDGPGKVSTQYKVDAYNLFLVYDYVHTKTSETIGSPK